MAVTTGPIFAADPLPPVLPTELDLNLLNLNGSNINVSLLLTICYTNSDGNPECEYSTNFPPKWYWSIYNGKSNIYAKPPAKNGTYINITVERYEMLQITAVVDGYISGDYYLANVTPIPPTTTTTTVPTTTTASTSTTTTTSTTTSTTTTTIGLAKISFDPDPKDFGVYQGSVSDIQSFNIINSGDGPFLGAFSSFISGPNASHFTLLGSPYISVPANSYVNVDVSFSASEPGFYSAVFNLRGEDAPGLAAAYMLNLFATIASPGSPTPINSCTTINSPGVYMLKQDLSSSDTCIIIESSDVVFDGEGYSISGSGSNYGIYVYNDGTTLTNVTVRNVRVTGWQYGIYYNNSENGSITNNAASNNGDGILLVSSSSNTIMDNTANSNNRGIYLVSSGSNTITNNTVSSNTYQAIYLDLSGSNSIENNNASNNYYGIYLKSSGSNTLTDNNVSNNNYDGITLRSSSNNILTDNTAFENKGGGIWLYSSSSNTITGNNASNNVFEGISLYLSSSSNIITGNVATNSYNLSGIYIESSNSNTITGNTASNNNKWGIYLYSSSNNIVTYNTAKENNYYDVYVSAGSDAYCNNIIDNNTGSGNRQIKYFNSAGSLQDETLSELILCNADNSNISNVTIEGSVTKKNNGFVVVRTDYSNFTNINSSNNYYGIYLASSGNNILTDNTAFENKGGGIWLYSSSSNTLTNNTISDITGETGDNSSVIEDSTGGMAVGIYLNSSTKNSLENNTISSINGGAGGGGWGGSGGMGAGIYLGSSTNNSLEGNIISDIKGGSSRQRGGPGGMGVGIYLSTSTDNSLENNTISNIKGGTGGRYGSGGMGTGIYLGSSTNNSLEGNIISDIKGSTGGREYRGSSGGPGGVGAGIYLSSSTNNSLLDNNISNISGGMGGPGVDGGNRGGVGTGIYLSSSTNNSLQDNTISDISGGAGSLHGWYGGSGGMGTGIYLSSSTNNSLQDNNIFDISGGIGGSVDGVGSGGSGGMGAGIYLSSSTNNSMKSNTISGIIGGVGSTGTWYGGSAGRGGNGAGIYLSSSTNNFLLGNTVSDITGGIGGEGYPDGVDGVGASIYLKSSSSRSNAIYNNFFNHSNNFGLGKFIRTNDWNTTKTLGMNIIGGPYLGGNYWAKPDGTGFSETCVDANGDGICDSNYILQGSGNVDFLPLAVVPPPIKISKVMTSGKTTVYTETREHWVLEIEVRNNDLTNLSNVVVSDTIPEEITLDSFTASKGSVSTTVKNGATRLTWTIGMMSPRDTETLVMDVSTRTVGNGMRTTQYFLEPGEYVLNEGASVSGNDGQITAGPTDPIIVYAQAKTRHRGRTGGGRHSR